MHGFADVCVVVLRKLTQIAILKTQQWQGDRSGDTVEVTAPLSPCTRSQHTYPISASIYTTSTIAVHGPGVAGRTLPMDVGHGGSSRPSALLQRLHGHSQTPHSTTQADIVAVAYSVVELDRFHAWRSRTQQSRSRALGKLSTLTCTASHQIRPYDMHGCLDISLGQDFGHRIDAATLANKAGCCACRC